MWEWIRNTLWKLHLWSVPYPGSCRHQEQRMGWCQHLCCMKVKVTAICGCRFHVLSRPSSKWPTGYLNLGISWTSKVSKNNLRTNRELPTPFHPQSSKDIEHTQSPFIFVSYKKGNFSTVMWKDHDLRLKSFKLNKFNCRKESPHCIS